MKIERPIVIVFTIFASLLVSSGAYAQAPSALVLEKSGKSVPEVQPYSEIRVGTTVSLPSGARLVFLHYYTCQTITVTGGAITFGLEGYNIKGGKKESEARGPCPRTVLLKAGGEVAGTLIRSGAAGGALRLSTSPTFVLVGPRAEQFAAARVSQGGKAVLETPMDGSRFRWPTGAAPLAVDTEYELSLVPKVSEMAPVTMKFRTDSSGVTPSDETLTLVHVE